MEQFREILEAVSAQLGGIANGDAVVGTPIKMGSVTLYPISRVSVAMGGGGGKGEAEASKDGHGIPGTGAGTGNGAGAGARARPVAVLVFSDEGVSVLPIADKKGKLDQLLEKIPELIEMAKSRSGGAQCC